MLGNNEAELITSSFVFGAALLKELVYFGGIEFKPTPFFGVGKTLENKVSFSEKTAIIKFKKGTYVTGITYPFLLLDGLNDFLRSLGFEPDRIEVKNSDIFFDYYNLIFEKDQNLTLLQSQLGFSGHFYDIPYAAISKDDGYVFRTTMMEKVFFKIMRKIDQKTKSAPIFFNENNEENNTIIQALCNELKAYHISKCSTDFFEVEKNENFFLKFSLNFCISKYKIDQQKDDYSVSNDY